MIWVFKVFLSECGLIWLWYKALLYKWVKHLWYKILNQSETNLIFQIKKIQKLNYLWNILIKFCITIWPEKFRWKISIISYFCAQKCHTILGWLWAINIEWMTVASSPAQSSPCLQPSPGLVILRKNFNFNYGYPSNWETKKYTANFLLHTPVQRVTCFLQNSN